MSCQNSAPTPTESQWLKLFARLKFPHSLLFQHWAEFLESMEQKELGTWSLSGGAAISLCGHGAGVLINSLCPSIFLCIGVIEVCSQFPHPICNLRHCSVMFQREPLKEQNKTKQNQNPKQIPLNPKANPLKKNPNPKPSNFSPLPPKTSNFPQRFPCCRGNKAGLRRERT